MTNLLAAGNITDRPPRTVFEADHELFRETVRAFIRTEVATHDADWEAAERVDRSLFRRAGKCGLLLVAAPEQYGRAGIDHWRFHAVLNEEFGRSGFASAALGLVLQNDVVGPYLLDLTTEEQKKRWLPGLTSGELIEAIAINEPGTGGDLSGIAAKAVRDDPGSVADCVINGSKTFISNGQNADLVVVASRTSEDRHRGLTLFVVETDSPEFERGRNLDKLSLHGQDASELHFTDIRVPAANRLGEEGDGFLQLMRNLPQERLSLAVIAVGAAEGMLARTMAYVTDRKAVGTPIGSFQNGRLLLAELHTEVDIPRVDVDHCVALHARGERTPVQAAKAKWWTTELQVRVADRFLQLHGGYGMRGHPIARAFADARIQTIYGGTTEIMKEIVGRDLGL